MPYRFILVNSADKKAKFQVNAILCSYHLYTADFYHLCAIKLRVFNTQLSWLFAF